MYVCNLGLEKLSENFVNNMTIFSVFFYFFCGCAEEGICVGGGF